MYLMVKLMNIFDKNRQHTVILLFDCFLEIIAHYLILENCMFISNSPQHVPSRKLHHKKLSFFLPFISLLFVLSFFFSFLLSFPLILEPLPLLSFLCFKCAFLFFYAKTWRSNNFWNFYSRNKLLQYKCLYNNCIW